MLIEHLSEEELFARRTEKVCLAELTKRYDYLVKQLARKFSGRGADLDDLEQVARLALLNAVDRFDADRGVKFSTYAGRTIIGEIKHHFRGHAWSVRVPRSLQELWLRTSRATGELSQQLGRTPTVRELAEFLDVTEEEVLEALDAGGGLRPASLDSPVGGDGSTTTLGAMLGEYDSAMFDALDWAELEPAIESLAERDRTIVYLRFFEGKTQDEIAQVVGVSQVHVSRLLRGALEQIREALDT